MIRNLLLAMVAAQNEANSAFMAGIEELAATDVTISYTKNNEGKNEKREIKGNALSFGVMPTLLSIQSSTVEIRTALSVAKTADTQNRSTYLFKTDMVDAKYQNAYNYKPETSSIIKLTIVPTPPSAEMLEAIKAVALKEKSKQ
ncbi:MAG: hypothetical protein M1540_04805 [Candidatus Bathyarchaeota archaeon]|nr:hypothetical protein [Candidatus Bathyarchaeota archaeon]